MPSNNLEKTRNLSGLIPASTRLSVIDYARTNRQDSFYLSCQKHRDFYKDATGLVQPVPAFEVAVKKFADPQSPTSEYFKQPIRYHTEMRPCNYPSQVGRSGGATDYSYEIRTKGVYSAFPCKCFKK